MADSVVRLAVIGTADKIADQTDMLRRLRNVLVAVTADSLHTALSHGAEFEAAVVNSPSDARHAAECGKHILVDAPLADSLAEAESLISLCRKAGVILAVAGSARHASSSQAIIDRLASGKLGKPGLLRVHRWCCDPGQSLSSILFGDIDLALHLFQATPNEIYAIGRGDHSYLQLHLGFPDGGMALLDFTQHLPAGQTYDSLSLIGSTGAAYADDHHNTQLLFAGGNPAALISNSGSGRLAELLEFVNCVAQGVLPAIDGRAILAVHRVIDAVRCSIESSRVLHNRGGVYE